MLHARTTHAQKAKSTLAAAAQRAPCMGNKHTQPLVLNNERQTTAIMASRSTAALLCVALGIGFAATLAGC